MEIGVVMGGEVGRLGADPGGGRMRLGARCADRRGGIVVPSGERASPEECLG